MSDEPANYEKKELKDSLLSWWSSKCCITSLILKNCPPCILGAKDKNPNTSAKTMIKNRMVKTTDF